MRGFDYDASGGAGGSTAVYLTAVETSQSVPHFATTYGIGLQEWNASTGVSTRGATVVPASTFASPPQINGVARLGSRVWVSWVDNAGKTWVQSLTQSSFALDTLTQLSSALAPVGLTSAQMGFGTDGTHLLLAAWTSSSNSSLVTINQYTVSSGAPTSNSLVRSDGRYDSRTSSLNIRSSGVTGRDGSNYVTSCVPQVRVGPSTSLTNVHRTIQPVHEGSGGLLGS